MSYVIINGNKYDIPELDFDAVCELEEYGVELMAINKNSPKIASTVRGFAAWVMGTDLKTASEEIANHINEGNGIAEILNSMIDAVQNSGFFKQGGKKQPQDHQKKNDKVKQYPTNNYPRNRAQRRANNKNRHANGNHSQK